MGIRDYISSTANAVNQNAVIPARNLFSNSYSYGLAATAKIGNQLPVDNFAKFATDCAKYAAVVACREGVKAIPGGGPIYDIVSRSISNNLKPEKNKKEEFEAASSALEDQRKQIEEMNDLIGKMQEEINCMKEGIKHEHDRDVESESKIQESSKIHDSTMRYLMTRTLQSNADKQPTDLIQNMVAKGFLSRYNLDNLDMPKKCPESS